MAASLSVYRRMDRPGLWANLSALRRGRWENEAESPLWGDAGGGKNGDNGQHVA